MILFSMMMFMFAIGMIRFGLRMAWDLSVFLCTIGLFIVCPILVIAILLGMITSNLANVIVIALICYFVYQLVKNK